MAKTLHGSACTTPRIRAERQGSKENTSALARRCDLRRTTVAKWRLCTTTSDASMVGPSQPKSIVLSPAESVERYGL